ncbi:MAG: hypothetical protein HY340_00895 [Candidatus Kerfeldbacteria bacterium]|nr:hypothetical protein [Candidatus Kerfeldbacteria bacterium]
MTWNDFLTITHIIGTALGVGGATFAEIFYQKAIADGTVDPTEGAFLRTTYRILRIGMILLVLSGFGYFLLFRLEDHGSRLYSEKIWAKLTIVALILVNAILLELRKIPYWLGSSISITSWYAALILGTWGRRGLSYFLVIALYVAALIVVTAGLELLRRKQAKGRVRTT